MRQEVEKMGDYPQKDNHENNVYDEKGNTMEGYGSINPSDVATLSLLGGGGGFGYGRGGYGSYGGYGTREAYDGTVINSKVDTNAQLIRDNNTDNKLASIIGSIADSRRETDQLINQSRMESQQQNADARAETAACCCETQKLVVQENNATRTLLLEQRIAAQDQTINKQGADANQAAILQAMNAQTMLLTELCSRRHHGG